MDISADVLVTFRRRRSGRLYQVGFCCGADNGLLILKEAWNTNSEIVKEEEMECAA